MPKHLPKFGESALVDPRIVAAQERLAVTQRRAQTMVRNKATQVKKRVKNAEGRVAKMLEAVKISGLDEETLEGLRLTIDDLVTDASELEKLRRRGADALAADAEVTPDGQEFYFKASMLSKPLKNELKTLGMVALPGFYVGYPDLDKLIELAQLYDASVWAFDPADAKITIVDQGQLKSRVNGSTDEGPKEDANGDATAL